MHIFNRFCQSLEIPNERKRNNEDFRYRIVETNIQQHCVKIVCTLQPIEVCTNIDTMLNKDQLGIIKLSHRKARIRIVEIMKSMLLKYYN